MKLVISLKTDSPTPYRNASPLFPPIHGRRHVESREESSSGGAKKISVDKGIPSLTNLS